MSAVASAERASAATDREAAVAETAAAATATAAANAESARAAARAADVALARVEAGEADPPCSVCGGILKSATVMFGERLDPQVLAEAMAITKASIL